MMEWLCKERFAVIDLLLYTLMGIGGSIFFLWLWVTLVVVYDAWRAYRD
jgi:hypothetical protein